MSDIKFTALLCHSEDKQRVIEIREAGGMSEKDTIAAILDAAWDQKDVIIAGLKATKVAVKAAQIAQRADRHAQSQAAFKAVRAQMRAGVAQSGASEAVIEEPALKPLGDIVKQHQSKRKGFTPAIVETAEEFSDPAPVTL